MIRNTVTLINTIKKLYPVRQFFKDRYFPDGKVYYSEKALIETKRRGRRIAPFVIPVVGGIAMTSEGYRTYQVEAPYIAPKMPITAAELERKAFGESPESGRTPESRSSEIQAEHMDEMRESILRRHEKMCTDLILTGEVVMKHYATAEDASKDKNYQVKSLRFYDEEEGFSNRYVFQGDFTQMTASEKIQEFYRISNILRKRGIRATDIVMTSDVSMLLMTDKDFLEFYDKKRVEYGNIKPEELPEGVVCNGGINVNGVIMTMFTYDEEYEDLDGNAKEFLPKGTIAFLHPGLGTTVYAQVTFVKDGDFKSYAEKIVPRLVSDEKNSIVEVQMFSRPVMYPYDWEGWMVANIYASGLDTLSLSDDGTGYSADPLFEGGGAGDGELKTAEEIEAMRTKADVIAYAESIGLTDLKDSSSLVELKNAVLDYQESLPMGDGYDV